MNAEFSLEEFGRQLEAAMKEADEMPAVPCPACGQTMCPEVGFGHVTAFVCMGFGCPFRGRISIDEVLDGDKWRTRVDEALIRKQQFEDMRRRNGAHERDDNHDPYCSDCHGYHQPTSEHPNCLFCGPAFVHAAMPKELYFNYRGWRFTPPFICMGCGIEVCYRQWAFSRSCGPCDVSDSRTRRILYHQCFAGPHEKLPEWNAKNGDIPEEHFIDPAMREKYPVMRMPKITRPQPRLKVRR